MYHQIKKESNQKTNHSPFGNCRTLKGQKHDFVDRRNIAMQHRLINSANMSSQIGCDKSTIQTLISKVANPRNNNNQGTVQKKGVTSELLDGQKKFDDFTEETGL